MSHAGSRSSTASLPAGAQSKGQLILAQRVVTDQTSWFRPKTKAITGTMVYRILKFMRFFGPLVVDGKNVVYDFNPA